MIGSEVVSVQAEELRGKDASLRGTNVDEQGVGCVMTDFYRLFSI